MIFVTTAWQRARCGILRWSCLLCLGLIPWTGCGPAKPKTYPAGGVIKYADGSPLIDAQIQFRAVGTSPSVVARGSTDNQGRFELTTFEPGDGAIEGQHMAAIMPYIPDDFDGMSAAERQRAMFPIDPIFKDFEKSKLEFTVTTDPAKNQFEVKVWQLKGQR